MTDRARVPTRPAPRPADVSTTPHSFGPTPVAVLMRLSLEGRAEYAWSRGTAAVQPLTSVISGQVRSANVLGPGGACLVFEDFDPRPRPVDPWDQEASIGPRFLELEDGTTRALPVAWPEGRLSSMEFAVAPDRRHVAVACTTIFAPGGRPPTARDGHVSIQLTAPDAAGPREIYRRQANVSSDASSRPVQWSPDGTRIAVSIYDLSGNPMSPIPAAVLILDASTGDTLTTINGVTLAGSASWTPDSTHVAVFDGRETHHLADTTSAALSPLRLPWRVPSGRRRWNLVGMAASDRVLVYLQRGSTGRIVTIGVDGEDERDVVSWRGEADMYVTAAQMPAGYWD